MDEATRRPNEAEIRRWNDERWTGRWTDREALTMSVTHHLLAALSLQAGERVLDVGCGGGWTTISAARAVGAAGFVTGVDLSHALLDLARRRADEAGVTNVAFEPGDAQVERLAGGPFDVVMSQFGVMFFDEPETAFSNLRAQLRPGGRLAFACWQGVEANPWHIGQVLAPFVPPPAPPAPGKSAVGPFSLGDVAQTTRLLEAAGFSGVSHGAYDVATEAGPGAIVDDSQLEFLGVAPERLDEARRAVAGHLARFHLHAGRYRFPLAFLVFEARAA